MSTKLKVQFIKNIFHVLLRLIIFCEIGFCKENRSGCYDTNEICKKCKCREDNTIVNCSYLELHEIPHSLPQNVVDLDLRRNYINALNSRSFENCFKLRSLRLSTNKISFIHTNTFRDAPINDLHLEKNKLDHGRYSMANVLSPLSNTLTTLFIHKNVNISHLILNNLHKLEELHLDGRLVDGFGKSFATLKSLKMLRLYPNMSNITNSTFNYLENITTLTNLSLKGAGVKRVESGAFANLKYLRSLDFSLNYGFGLNKVENFLNSLTDDLEELILTKIFTKERKLQERFCKSLSPKKKLKNLKLNRNRLNYVSYKLTLYIRSLTYLDLSKNHLTDVKLWPFFIFFLHNLKDINFDNQEEDPRPHRRMKNFPGYSEHPCKATAIKTIPPCQFPKKNRNTTWCGICPKHLEYFYFSSFMKKIEARRSNLPPLLMFGRCQIKELYFRNNGLTSALGPVVMLGPLSDELVSIDLGNNNMECFAPDILKFSIARGLRVGRLILDGNDLSYQLEYDEEGRTFAVYSSLKELNLSKNRLRILQRLSFYNLRNLEILNLSTNYITSLSFDLSQMKNLKRLDLTDNRLVTFDDKSISAISSLNFEKCYGWLRIYVENNAFTCSCEYLNFMDWIVTNDTYIENVDQIKCTYRNTSMKLSEIKNKIHEVRALCNHFLPLIISGGLLALLIISTLVGSISYKYRWDIRYFLIVYSQKKKQYQLLLDQTNDYVYDAFVSYDMNDRSWIVQELIPNLEGKPAFDSDRSSVTRGNTSVELACETHDTATTSNRNYVSFSDSFHDILASTDISPTVDDSFVPDDGKEITHKLCIHERDFELGNEIENNILNAIQMSRMVILIVTNDFVKSKWCRLEVEMSKMESLERGRNIVITVFLEPIQKTLESLEWFMKRYTYLEWFTCDSKTKKDEFWKRMRLALEGKNKKIVCQCGGRRLIDD